MRNHYYYKIYFIIFTIIFIKSLSDLSESISFRYECFILNDSFIDFIKGYTKY